MYYVLYNSYATIQFDDETLKELLVKAREKNERLAITGMLYFFDKQFIQLIEGEEAAVRQLAAEIENDPRHNSFMVLKQGNNNERYFEDWSMGFKSIDPSKFSDVEQFKELNNAKETSTSSVMHLMKILSS